LSTLAFAAALALALVLYFWWDRSDRNKEQVAQRIVEDLQAMGDVVATSLSPSIDPDRCIGSGACVAACPEKGVIALVGARAALVNPLGCIGHGACASACPVSAISLVYGTKTRGVELPVVDQNFQTQRAGVYIAGELGGMGLIRNAINQGRQAAEHIIQGIPSPRRGGGEVLDALVVGAGPAGISATLRLMQAGLRVLLIDRESFGGTILHYPRAKVVMTGALELPLYGRVSRQELSKEELVSLWTQVREKLDPPFVAGELVTGLEALHDGNWSVVSDRAVHRAANVILALGGRGSPQKLGVVGEEHPKVSYRLLEPREFAGKHALVVGGGNSAVESALALADYQGCASVGISYRRGEFARCRAQNRERIASAIQRGAVNPYLSTELEEIADGHVTLRDAHGARARIANDAVIVQIGGTPPARLLGSLGIQLVTKYGER
jgi:thioredoxin reductase/NAD-dependent dihydropyrimidine dehydrogenase PreA subunit